MTPVKMPKNIDAPMQMAFWEIDEVAPMIGLLALGILTGTLTYMFILMFVVTKLYQRYKTTARRGAVLHLLWWHGIYNAGGRWKNGQARLFIS
ncbi:MAG: type IV conjugative transfer system protein TraL [Gammaproteobacteria bacterium]|nr:MAG: type IV conjugative transfer system protein TraL [Gammaproteobacteria bacterium]